MAVEVHHDPLLMHATLINSPVSENSAREIKIQNFRFIECGMRNSTHKLYFQITGLTISYGIKINKLDKEARDACYFENKYKINTEWKNNLESKILNKEILTIRLEPNLQSGSLKVYVNNKIVVYISDTTVGNRKTMLTEKNIAMRNWEWFTIASLEINPALNSIDIFQVPLRPISLKETAFRMSEKSLYIKDQRGIMIPNPEISQRIPLSVIIGVEIDVRYDLDSMDRWCPFLHPLNLRKKKFI